MIFIDTSVVIAILAEEDDARHWAECIERSNRRTTSALVILEAVMRLSTKLGIEPQEVSDIVNRFIEVADVVVISIDAADASLAVEAFSKLGKGRGHPAQLNLADCLSYACAKNRGLRLLYKGNDFSLTDMA